MINKNALFDTDGTELDDIAYQLYLDDMWEKGKDNDNYDYWETQHYFRMWGDTKKYYEQANIILRNRKIDNIKKDI